MKNMVPALSPLMRSNAQGDILAALVVDSEREQTIADIARQTGVNPSQVHREIVRLELGGITSSRLVGRARLIRVNPAYPLLAAVREIVLASYGPRIRIGSRLSREREIRKAYIYGSWAARYVGEAGPIPQDIDVLVVGETPRRTLETIASDLGRELRREVSIQRVGLDEWSSPQTPFIRTLKERPLVEIELSADD